MINIDIYNTERRYSREKDKLLRKNASAENKKRIFAFLRTMEVSEISYVQLVKYTCSIRTFLEVCNKDFLQVKSSDVEDYILSMKDLSPKTRNIRYYSLRKFFKYMGRGRSFRIKLNRDHKQKLPDEILTVEEVDRMVECGRKHKAFLAILYESGCRIGEFLKIDKNRDVAFDEHGAILQVTGKTGQRRIRIVKYAALLQEHVQKAVNLAFPVSYAMTRKIIKSVASRAGIQKRVHPHLFRHSRATHLAKHLTEQELKVFFGWSGGSSMPATYVHLSGRDIDDKLLKIHGKRDLEMSLNNPSFRRFVEEQWKKQAGQNKLSEFATVALP